MKSVSPSNAADDGTSLNASTTKPDDVPHDLETLMLPMILGGKSAQIAFNDIKIPSAHVSSMIKHQMEKKRFFSFFIYLIFYLVFMMSSFDIPENGSTLSIWRAAEALAVKMSRVNNSEGHPTLRFDMSVWSDQSDATSANAWIANSLAAVEMRLLELCPKCKLYRDVTPVSFDGTHSTLSFEKASAIILYRAATRHFKEEVAPLWLTLTWVWCASTTYREHLYLIPFMSVVNGFTN